MPRRRPAVDLDELIVMWEAKAAQACRDHDQAAEWDAECHLYELWERRAQLAPPTQRRSRE